MSKARDRILGRLQRNAHSEAQAATRLNQHPRGPQPQWPVDLLTRFVDKLTVVSGSYQNVPDPDVLPNAISEYLAAQQLTHTLTLAPHPLLEAIDWPASVTVQYGKASADTVISVSVADCGIAETGSLMLLASSHTPTSLNFLADHFLCVLRVRDIVPHMEDAWDHWRAKTGTVPRAINLITGPSRTADVEQIIQLGAHGPRQLHVLLLEQA